MRPDDAPRAPPGTSPRHPVLLAAVAMFVAFNIRPALTSVGPLLNRIDEATGLGGFGLSLLTTLPVLCLGLAGVLGPWAIRRLGIDRGILAGIVAVTAGLSLRGVDDVASLFAGSMIAALGIGVAGVLLPALVKREFGPQAGWMMGVYTMALCLGAAAGAGLTVPVQDRLGWGWAGALALWALPAGVSAVTWIPFARSARAERSATSPAPELRRDPLAWQVTGFMGLQSSLAYILFGWLPVLLQSHGLSARDAGFIASVITLGQAPGALVIAALASRARDQRGWIVGVVLVTIVTFLVMAFGPSVLLVPVGIVLGIGVGGCFGLGLSLIVLRAPDARVAGALSAMAQGVGYTLASLGPFGFGLAHKITDGWVLPAVLFCGLALAALACGLGAGRRLHVADAQAARGP